MRLVSVFDNSKGDKEFSLMSSSVIKIVKVAKSFLFSFQKNIDMIILV